MDERRLYQSWSQWKLITQICQILIMIVECHYFVTLFFFTDKDRSLHVQKHDHSFHKLKYCMCHVADAFIRVPFSAMREQIRLLCVDSGGKEPQTRV